MKLFLQVFQTLLLVVFSAFALGGGLCGAVGVYYSISNNSGDDYSGFFSVIMMLIGFGFMTICGLAARGLLRNLTSAPPPGK